MARSIILVNDSTSDWVITQLGSFTVPAESTLDITEGISDDELINATQKGLGLEFDAEHYLRIDGIDKSAEESSSFGSSLSNHEALRQLIHFIDSGPAEGFASGAYKESVGGIFPTSIIWYDKSGTDKKKIIEKLITWTNAFPTTIVWKVYDSVEVLQVTVTDTISYSGASETSRTRVIT